MGHVIFALPWFITWYSHVLDDLEVILRLYDFFLVSHSLMPLYLAAQVRILRHDLRRSFIVRSDDRLSHRRDPRSRL